MRHKPARSDSNRRPFPSLEGMLYPLSYGRVQPNLAEKSACVVRETLAKVNATDIVAP
jgi:hypothetical protein